MNVLNQIKGIFERDGLDYELADGQFVFMMLCGPFEATFRIYQNGPIAVLMATTDFAVPPERRSVVAEFCSYANFVLLAFSNLELDPELGHVVLRHSVMLPAEGKLVDDQLRAFIAWAGRMLSNLSGPIVRLAISDADDPKALVYATQASVFPGLVPHRKGAGCLEPGEA